MRPIRSRILSAGLKVEEVANSVGIKPRLHALYSLAAQLTIAECSQVIRENYRNSSDNIQEMFVQHFEFLCDHTVDCLLFNNTTTGKKNNGCNCNDNCKGKLQD